MTKRRPEQQRPPAKKLTREVMRENPLLAALARQRLKEIRELRRISPTTDSRDTELPIPELLPDRESKP